MGVLGSDYTILNAATDGILRAFGGDATTVVVTLSAPNGTFLVNMAWGDAVIVAPESIDDAVKALLEVVAERIR